MTLRYKFVELSVVTDDSLEECVNDWVGRGWHLDQVRFVIGEASRRPQMAFVSFVSGAAAERPAVVADERAARAPEPTPRVTHELGELDPGELEPWDAELDWSHARGRRRRAAPAEPAAVEPAAAPAPPVPPVEAAAARRARAPRSGRAAAARPGRSRRGR